MKKIFALIFLFFAAPALAYTTPDGVCGFASGHTVQARQYNLTDSIENVAYTATGVTEQAGITKSCYVKSFDLLPGQAYLLCMKDVDASPIREQCWTVPSYQTYVDAAISSRLSAILQSQVYTAVATPSREVAIIRGDTPRITFDLGADYSGYTAHFGAKAALADTAYVIAVREATWTDAAAGEGYIDLPALETAATGRLYGEIELRSGAQRLTGMRFILRILEDVIK